MNYRIYVLAAFLVLIAAFAVEGGYVEINSVDAMATLNQPTASMSIDGSSPLYVEKPSKRLESTCFAKLLVKNLFLGAISHNDFFSLFSKHTFAALPDIKQATTDQTFTEILEVLDSFIRPIPIDNQNKIQIHSATPFGDIGGF